MNRLSNEEEEEGAFVSNTSFRLEIEAELAKMVAAAAMTQRESTHCITRTSIFLECPDQSGGKTRIGNVKWTSPFV